MYCWMLDWNFDKIWIFFGWRMFILWLVLFVRWRELVIVRRWISVMLLLRWMIWEEGRLDGEEENGENCDGV